MSSNDVRPGLHAGFSLAHFSAEELSIIDNLKSHWYLTNGGGDVCIGKSSYSYFLMKPTKEYTELFNLKREIVVVFSDFANFEPRNLDPFEYVLGQYPDLRIDRISFVLVSRDSDIEKK